MRWTPDEIIFLQQNYPNKGVEFCAKSLNRTSKSVRRKAETLSISVIPEARANRALTHKEYEDKLYEIEATCFPVHRDYVNNKTPILHECVEGHQWLLRPVHALEGRSCPTCAKHGFNPGLPGLTYYVKIEFENLTYYKIGVTNRTVQKRFEKDFREKKITILKEWYFNNGQDALDLERSILQIYPAVTIENFLLNGGNTELFECDILDLDR